MKITIILISILMFAGCSGAGHHYKEYYPTGALKVKEDTDFMNFMVTNKRKGIDAETSRVKLKVGVSDTAPDANSVKAIVEGTVEGLKVF